MTSKKVRCLLVGRTFLSVSAFVLSSFVFGGTDIPVCSRLGILLLRQQHRQESTFCINAVSHAATYACHPEVRRRICIPCQRARLRVEVVGSSAISFGVPQDDKQRLTFLTGKVEECPPHRYISLAEFSQSFAAFPQLPLATPVVPCLPQISAEVSCHIDSQLNPHASCRKLRPSQLSAREVLHAVVATFAPAIP